MRTRSEVTQAWEDSKASMKILSVGLMNVKLSLYSCLVDDFQTKWGEESEWSFWWFNENKKRKHINVGLGEDFGWWVQWK